MCGTFQVALGDAPTDHKQMEGDCRTPEGHYFICSRNPESKYYKSLGISYPNSSDAHVAFQLGRIKKQDLKAIVHAEARRKRPPWDTPLGGFIMIHGGGIAYDWTKGCIALRNEDMDTLWDALQIGDGVDILP